MKVVREVEVFQPVSLVFETKKEFVLMQRALIYAREVPVPQEVHLFIKDLLNAFDVNVT